MLKDSGLLNSLQRVAYSPTGDVQCLYGDSAYPLCRHLMAHYRLGEVSVFAANMKVFNEAMNSVRVSVEWLCGDVLIIPSVFNRLRHDEKPRGNTPFQRSNGDLSQVFSPKLVCCLDSTLGSSIFSSPNCNWGIDCVTSPIRSSWEVFSTTWINNLVGMKIPLIGSTPI